MAATPPPDWAIRALRERIDASGLSTSEFAQTRLMRPATTLYRWLRGENPIPQAIRIWLRGGIGITAKPKPTTTEDPDDI